MTPAFAALSAAVLAFFVSGAIFLPATQRYTFGPLGVPPAERGVVVGTASLFVDVAFGLSPAALGLLATATGYPPTFLVSGVIAAIGAAWLLIRRPGRIASAPA